MLRANLYNAGGALAVVGEEELALDALQRAIGAGLAGGRTPIGSDYAITHGFRRSLSASRGDNRDCNQRQQSPRTAARPSLIRNGISARAATLSSHHQPSNQVAAKPTIKTMER
jgi:uncharacterized membrane protein